MERVMSASEFKAKCLACLTEIEQSGESITITRRGRPVAVLGPTKQRPGKSLRGRWKGKIQVIGDIENLDTSDLWDCVKSE
jgi:prevent-host-death family protein